MIADRFDIHETLHASETVQVQKAVRKGDNQPVILKIGRAGTERDYLLRHEYEMCRLLDGRFAVLPFEFSEINGNALIVFPDEGMQALANLIPSEGFELATFLDLAIKICAALETVHSLNIVHKDINPTNIVVDSGFERLKLIDFQLASRMKRESMGITPVSGLEGTLAYIAPEQTGRVNRVTDYRADLYSLGVTFYQLLTGTLPFGEQVAIELVHSHIAKNPPPPVKRNSPLPQVVSAIVMKLLAKSAEDRYQSVLGLSADLERCKQAYEETGAIMAFPLAENDIPRIIQVSQKLYGREDETEELFALFDRVADGAAQTVFISGPSGAGKTALIREIYKPVTAKRGNFAAGKFNPLQRDTPYLAISKAFNELCRTVKTAPDKIVHALGTNAGALIEIVPELKRLIGEQPHAPVLSGTEAQNRLEFLFRSLVKILCSTTHPLVLFFDDLQWADSASLQIIRALATDEEMRHLLLLLSFRSNEIYPGDPLHQLRKQLSINDTTFTEIKVTNLEHADIEALLADSLNGQTEGISDLAELIHEMTDGNAFHTHQYIQMLADEELLTFDHALRLWQWDTSRIRRKYPNENLALMMAERIDRLPADSVRILHLSACIGDEFSLQDLGIILDLAPDETFTRLEPALHEGLITPLSGDYKILPRMDRARFRFLHDRVREAAYGKDSEASRKQTHLTIGRHLLKHTSDELLPERILTIATQFTRALSLVSDSDEREGLARLFLTAGRKAKSSAAYAAAFGYLSSGIDCLPPDPAHLDGDLFFDLHLEAIDSAFLDGEYDEMERLINELTPRLRSLDDEARIRRIEIQALIAQNQRKQGITVAVSLLRKLGIELEETPSGTVVQESLSGLKNRLKKKNAEEYIDSRRMNDQTLLLSMQIMATATSAAFVASPNLMILLIIKQVELSMQAGFAPETSYALVFLGVVLCGITGDIDLGYHTGLAGIRMQARQGDKQIQTKTTHVFNDLVRPWKQHISVSLPELERNYTDGMELGDIEFAAYSAHIYCCYLFFSGRPLSAVEEELDKYTRGIERLNQADPLSWNRIHLQTVQDLRAPLPPALVLEGAEYSTRENLSRHLAANDKMSLCYLYLSSCMLNYLYRRYDLAAEAALRGEEHLDGATGKYTAALHRFYASLTDIARTGTSPRVEETLIRMEEWAESAPENFSHKHALLQAEILRSEKRSVAMEWYERAIEGARDGGFLQEEALAFELAAGFYLDRGIERIAATYLNEALQLYQRWGAVSKCSQLKQTYSWLLQHSETPTTSSRSLSESHIDQQSIIKASQAISREVDYRELQARLISIAVENAGADRGVLILKEKQRYWVQAVLALPGKTVETRKATPLEEYPDIARSVVNQVAKRGEALILADAYSDERFKEDAYVRSQRSRSILCMPIIHQQTQTGLLYLENGKLTNVFGRDRLSILEVLLTQAAISIENAGLFANLNRERTYSNNLIKHSPSLICGIARGGITNFVNPAIERITGYSRDELVGKNWWETFYPGDDYSQVEDLFARLKISDVEGYEMRLTCKSGEVRTVAWQSLTRRDDRGEIIEIIGFGNDITERVRAEAELRANEERLDMALAGAQDGIWDWDLRSNYVAFDERYYRMAGYTPYEFPENFVAWEERVHPDDVEDCRLAIAAYIEGKRDQYDVEFRFRRKDGAWMWIRSRGKIAAWDREGNPIRFVGTHSDISDRKAVEEALRTSEERFELAMEASHDGLYDWNIERNEVYFSPGWKRILGYEMNELPNEFSIWEQLTDPEDVARSWQMLDELSQGKRDRFEMEFRMRHKKGHWVDVLSRAQAVFNADGKAVRLIGTHQDITKRKEAEQRIRRDLEERDLLLKELYHRTKNNMQVIISLMRMKSLSHKSPELEQIIGEISNKIRSMALVHQMLYQSDDLTQIDLGHYIEELSTMLIHSGASDQRPVRCERQIENLHVSIDAAIPVGMIIAELMANSLKHGLPDSAAAPSRDDLIRIGLRGLEPGIELSYSDNGRGIDPGTDLRQSSSVGLQTVFSLIEHQLLGEVRYESTDGLHWWFTFDDSINVDRIPRK